MDETTQQMIEQFQTRLQTTTRGHLQDLEIRFSDALRRDLEALNRPPPPPLAKRVLRRIGKVGQCLGRKLLDCLDRRGGRPVESTQGEASPTIIEGAYRVLSPRQEGEK